MVAEEKVKGAKQPKVTKPKIEDSVEDGGPQTLKATQKRGLTKSKEELVELQTEIKEHLEAASEEKVEPLIPTFIIGKARALTPLIKGKIIEIDIALEANRCEFGIMKDDIKQMLASSQKTIDSLESYIQQAKTHIAEETGE